jgi:DNA-directed RNA polymerase specialized sigma24 family protein
MQDPPDEVTPSDPQPGEGRASAFEAAYLRYAPRLERISITRFGIPAADANELVQDVFEDYLYRVDEVESLEGYLIGALCDVSRHYLRRGTPSETPLSQEPCPIPHRVLLYDLKRMELLSQVVAGLGQPCRDLLYRFYRNGESAETIAADLQLPRETVEANVFECRHRLLEAYWLALQGRDEEGGVGPGEQPPGGTDS